MSLQCGFGAAALVAYFAFEVVEMCGQMAQQVTFLSESHFRRTWHQRVFPCAPPHPFYYGCASHKFPIQKHYKGRQLPYHTLWHFSKQIPHSKGLEPTCMTICRFTLRFQVNPIPQIPHSKCLVPVWVCMCPTQSLLLRLRLPQISHSTKHWNRRV